MSTNFWDDRYAAPAYAYGTQPNDFVGAMAARIPAGPVLCLAEGEGRNAVYLAQCGHAVMAVDSSGTGLAKAQALALARGVPLVTKTADLAEYRIEPASWSGIVATWAHLPPRLRRSVHAQVVTGLRLGGVFILEAYTPAQIAFGTGGPRDKELCMTLGGLREELVGLELEIGRECERDVIEGTYHTGRSAVVQVLARRI